MVEDEVSNGTCVGLRPCVCMFVFFGLLFACYSDISLCLCLESMYGDDEEEELAPPPLLSLPPLPLLMQFFPLFWSLAILPP